MHNFFVQVQNACTYFNFLEEQTGNLPPELQYVEISTRTLEYAHGLGNPLGIMLPQPDKQAVCGLLIAHTLVRFAEHEGKVIALPGYKTRADAAAGTSPWYSPFTGNTYTTEPGEDVVPLGKGYAKVGVDRAEFVLDGFAVFPVQDGELAEPVYVPNFEADTETIYTLSCTYRGAEKVFRLLSTKMQAAGLVDGKTYLLTFIAWLGDIVETQKPGFDKTLVAFKPVAINWFWRPLSNTRGRFVSKLVAKRQSLAAALAAQGIGVTPAPAQPVVPAAPVASKATKSKPAAESAPKATSAPKAATVPNTSVKDSVSLSQSVPVAISAAEAEDWMYGDPTPVANAQSLADAIAALAKKQPDNNDDSDPDGSGGGPSGGGSGGGPSGGGPSGNGVGSDVDDADLVALLQAKRKATPVDDDWLFAPEEPDAVKTLDDPDPDGQGGGESPKAPPPKAPSPPKASPPSPETLPKAPSPPKAPLPSNPPPKAPSLPTKAPSPKASPPKAPPPKAPSPKAPSTSSETLPKELDLAALIANLGDPPPPDEWEPCLY